MLGASDAFRKDALGVCRRSLAVAKDKLSFLEVVPYLFASLDREGVRGRVIQQWLSVPVDHHHPLTRAFMLPGGPRDAIDRMNDDGTGMSPLLCAEMLRLREVPFDDSVGEGTHAQASRIGAAARAARWGWIASRIRLQHTVKEFRDLSEATGY